MNKNFRFYTTLFFSMLRISAFTFGGGFVIVTLLKKEFVDKRHWLQEKKMLDYVAIAQSSPGAIAVNASLLVGYDIAGVAGAILSVIATVLPPLIILSILAPVYSLVSDNVSVGYTLAGMQAGVCAVLCDVVISLYHTVTTDKKPYQKGIVFLLIAAAFLAVSVFLINSVYIILASAALGLLLGYGGKKTHDLS